MGEIFDAEVSVSSAGDGVEAGAEEGRVTRGGVPLGEAPAPLRRQRWEKFCRDLLVRVEPDGGWTEGALIEAYERNFGSNAGRRNRMPSSKRSLKLAKNLLKVTAIQERLGIFFERVTDYDIAKAANRLVDHIEGRIEKEVLTKKGEVVTLKVPPSLPALTAFLKMTVPMPAEKVHMRHSLERQEATEKEALPRMEARILSTTVEAGE